MDAVLYAIPASHPCAAVEHALRLKGLPYRRVELVPVAHRLVQRLRFGAGIVPVLVLADGKRAIGSRPIMRALEARRPAPALLPEEPDRRARVERAEEWGDQVLQPLVRRVLWAALRRSPEALMSYAEGARLPLPRPVARLSAPLVTRAAQALNGADDLTVRADLRALEGHVRRVEAWIADGTLGAGAPTVADLQVGAGLRLLLTVADLGTVLDDRPAAALARRWFPDYPGAAPPGSLPAAWIPAA